MKYKILLITGFVLISSLFITACSGRQPPSEDEIASAIDEYGTDTPDLGPYVSYSTYYYTLIEIHEIGEFDKKWKAWPVWAKVEVSHSIKRMEETEEVKKFYIVKVKDDRGYRAVPVATKIDDPRLKRLINKHIKP